MRQHSHHQVTSGDAAAVDDHVLENVASQTCWGLMERSPDSFHQQNGPACGVTPARPSHSKVVTSHVHAPFREFQDSAQARPRQRRGA